MALHLGKGGKNVSVGTYCDYSEDYTFYSDWKAVFDKGISVSGASVTDFVVEQGTIGIWTYRKWNSGMAECWGTATVSVLCKNQSGSCWFTDDLTIALPTGLFTENGVVNMNCHDYWCWVAKAHMSLQSVKQISCSGKRKKRLLPKQLIRSRRKLDRSAAARKNSLY